MQNSTLPDWLAERVFTPEEALHLTVKNGTRIASGFATSEPVAFYASLWDHIQAGDLRDISIRQALFMAPHKLCVGDALESHGLLDGLVDNGFGSISVFGNLARAANNITKKMDGLNKLLDHFHELQDRRIRFISAFLGQASNMMIPRNAVTTMLAPYFADRNPSRMGIVDMQSAHFPDAVDAIIHDPDGLPIVDLLVAVVTPPDENGEISNGVANGATGEALERACDEDSVKILLYLNKGYPFTRGYADAPNTLPVERLRDAARKGRLFLVEDDTPIPALPAGSFDHPAETELKIAENVVNHMELHRHLTYGRAIQVGFGGTGVLAIKNLLQSSWHGRVYTEMLEPFTMNLVHAGKISGSHFVEKNGLRTDLPGKVVCTFSLGVEGDDFYERLHNNPDVIFGPSSRVVIPEAFYGGLGINNILGIDFQGHVNSGGKGPNHYSGVGGAAMINRGLARGGVAYLCMKSMHTGLDGKRHSSVFPYLPEGTPISLTGPDIMGTREGAHFFLATEWGIARINALPQSEFIKAIISVAHPDEREELGKRAYEEFRVRL